MCITVMTRQAFQTHENGEGRQRLTYRSGLAGFASYITGRMQATRHSVFGKAWDGRRNVAVTVQETAQRVVVIELVDAAGRRLYNNYV